MPEQPLHVSRIHPHPDNARKQLRNIDELAASIRAQGLLSPLTVCAHPHIPAAYQLLAGHRRLAALKLLRKDYVPAKIVPAPSAAEITMLVENCQRDELTAAEKAEAMGRLREQGYSPARISRETGLAPSTVSRYLSLLELDQPTRDRVRDGQVAVGDAIAAVHSTRAAARKQRGERKPGPRKVTVEAPHFSVTHRLAEAARVACELAGHQGRKIGASAGYPGACGACWEHVIRKDERTAGRVSGLRQVAL